MLDLIKKNWVFVLALAVLILAAKLFWPENPDEPPVTPEPEVLETVEAERPEPSPVPSVSPAPVQAAPVVVETKENIEEPQEEIYPEEEEAPQKRNFVLCEHIVSGESRYEFTGQIRLINKGTEPIYGWTVTWEYEDGSTITEATGVALAGNNPYTGQYLSENAEIAPGKTVTFSFTGVKGGEYGPRGIDVKGNFCI